MHPPSSIGIFHRAELRLWRMWRVGGLFQFFFVMEVLLSSIFFLLLFSKNASISSIASIVAGQGGMEDRWRMGLHLPSSSI